MQRVNYNTISAFILVIVAGIAIWETRDLSEMSYIFPRTIGIILLLLSIAYLINSLIKPKHNKLLEGIDKRKVAVMSAGMISYVILIGLVGFLIASMMFIGFLTWYLQRDNQGKSGRAKIADAAIGSISVSVLFFVLFRYVFLVPLPTGLLFG
ncbi:tripartite tricarboxylate transporter TctB family protein [Lentibacillus jeotgali]|uniref:tripartite tricarboxylate transporter TctB family protein n=1 Tax=Lentibacillus jeotgali TaxID=558169 RepID=UPI000262648F|nr:tripartite tricarboxylate transporter TctB family protein [Lentibacillus jeotgali]